MKTTISTLLLLLIVSLLTVARAANTHTLIRGGAPSSLANPFACSLAAADEDSCVAATDDDGNACVWCEFASSGGACVSSEQAEEISNVVPQVTCSDDTHVLQNPVDVNCLAAGMGGKDDAQSVCDDTLDASGSPCVWCNIPGSEYGACLSSHAAESAGQYLTCDAAEDDVQDDDLMECIQRKEENECNDEKCTWCNTMAGFGVCFSEEALQVAKMYEPLFQCDDDESGDDIQAPWDPTCLLAGIKQGADQNSCESTEDQYGNPCVWCNGNANTNNMGLCMTFDQSSVASQWLTCDGSPNDAIMIGEPVVDPMDPTCLVVGYQGGNEATCQSTNDQDGNACVWCNGPNDIGICLSSDQASMAGQWLTCDDHALLDEGIEDAAIESPLDPTCIEAGLQGDKDSCEASQDQDGNACVWCDAGDDSTGLCLNTDQASMASQWLTCDDPALVDDEEGIESPMDPTCIEAGLQGDKDSCEATQDQDGNACVWCDTGDASTGLCLNTDQASMASQWLTCDDSSSLEDLMIHQEEEMASPTDPTCLAAGYQADDAEATCHATNDADGNACVWCTGPSPNMGVCLSSDQASMAGQWLTCEDGDEIAASMS